eukprot:scaffold1725_cov195-Alexandrium_tamarense.AAC.11
MSMPRVCVVPSLAMPHCRVSLVCVCVCVLLTLERDEGPLHRGVVCVLEECVLPSVENDR